MLYCSISQLRNLQVLDMSKNKLPDNLPHSMQFQRLQPPEKLNISEHDLMTLIKRYVLQDIALFLFTQY